MNNIEKNLTPNIRPWDTEAQEIVNKWAMVRDFRDMEFLSNINNDKQLKNIAVLLENQRLMNYGNHNQIINSILLYMVKEVYSNIIANYIASVHAMLRPTEIINDKLDVVCARARKLPVEFPTMWYYKTTPDSLENIKPLINEIIKDIDHEILTDIGENCSTVSGWDKTISLDDKIEETSKLISSKCNTRPNWIVCSKETAPLIKNDHLMTIYIDNSIENKILLGNNINENYFYTPYIPFAFTPVVLTKDFTPKKYLLSRYDKKLLVSGPKNYGKIMI